VFRILNLPVKTLPEHWIKKPQSSIFLFYEC